MLKASVWPSYGAGNKRSIIEDNHRDNIQRRLRLIPTTKMKMIIKEATTIQTTTEEGTTTTRREKDKSLVVLFEINKRRSRVPAQEEEEVLFFVHKSARIFNLPVPFGLDSDSVRVHLPHRTLRTERRIYSPNYTKRKK
jgi:hypothetical protein